MPKRISFEKLVVFIGQTGFGKSSTLNAIVDQPVLKTSAVEPCTRLCQSLDFRIKDDHWLSLVDMPGVGESIDHDSRYLEMYESLIGYASAIVYVTRADARDHAIDESVVRCLLNHSSTARRVVYAIGQCDKVEPLSRVINSKPTAAQMKNISTKVADITERFDAYNPVIPYSAATHWNLKRLVAVFARVAAAN